MTNVNKVIPSLVTVDMLLQTLDTTDSPYKLEPSIHGWFVTLVSKKQTVLVNSVDLIISYEQLVEYAKHKTLEILFVLHLINSSKINLNKLTELVFNMSIDVGMSNTRISTTQQIDRTSTEIDGIYDYSIFHLTDNTLGRFHIPRQCVTVSTVNSLALIKYLNEFLKNMSSFLNTVKNSDKRFSPEAYDITTNTNSIILSAASITKRLPSVSRELTIESDLYTLRINNVSFESSSILKSPPISMFGTYELDCVLSLNSIIEKTIPSLLIFIYGINVSNAV